MCKNAGMVGNTTLLAADKEDPHSPGENTTMTSPDNSNDVTKPCAPNDTTSPAVANGDVTKSKALTSTKINAPKAEKRTSKYELKDADRRWSWVILVATFFNYIVVSAIWYSFSVLYQEFAYQFDRSLATIGVLASVEAAAMHFTGAMCTGLVESYGSRPVAMAGSLVAAVALLCGAFVNSLTALYVVYGIAGSGIGVSYVSFVVIIQQYFDKQRTLASGFSLTGFSIASFSLPPFTRWMLDKYGWRGTLMIISGFYLNGIVLAALLRPPPLRKLPKTRTRHVSFSQKVTRQMSLEKTRSRMSKFCAICRKVFDYRMFKDVRFVLYGFGTFFMMVGNIAFFMHLVNRAKFLGISPTYATFLPSIYGIANGVCRLVFSVVANLPKCNRIVQYGLWIVLGGIISCLSGFATDFVGMAVVCAGFGMCVGAFICIQYPALVDLLGVNKITRSTGLLQIFIGSAGLVATPLAGRIYDVTNDFNIPYFTLGSIMVLGGIIILIIPLLKHCGYQPHSGRRSSTRRQSTRDLEEKPESAPNLLENEDLEKGMVIVEEPKSEDSSLNEHEFPSCQYRLRTLSASSHLQVT